MSMAPRVERPLAWYSAIVHLVTAADGAPAAFEAAHRGATRDATIDRAVDALAIDNAVAALQQSHPGYVRIDNSTDFERKLARAVEAVLARLEPPV